MEIGQVAKFGERLDYILYNFWYKDSKWYSKELPPPLSTRRGIAVLEIAPNYQYLISISWQKLEEAMLEVGSVA
jgi:hypothetical protein